MNDDSIQGTFTVGEEIQGRTSGAKAFVLSEDFVLVSVSLLISVSQFENNRQKSTNVQSE